MKNYFIVIALCLTSLTPCIADEYFRRIEEFDLNVPVFTCYANGYESNDEALIKRIILSYQKAKKEHLGNSMWQGFFEQQRDIHNAFVSGDFKKCANILRNPKDNELFYGFELMSIEGIAYIKKCNLTSIGIRNLDFLVRFGESISAFRLDNPELYGTSEKRKWNSNQVLSSIENKLGKKILFPNPFKDEIGIWTSKGVASERAIWSLYQAYLISEHLKGIENPKVLEIGAGLGRNAYYSRLFGIKDYTIIDIPISNMAQAYFLGTVLGEQCVSLLGEKGSNEQIKILTPDQFLNEKNQYYDLIINVDSLTELDQSNMDAYINKISVSTPKFISINHEGNAHTVGDFTDNLKNLNHKTRNIHWMRKGYVEEIYEFNQL